MEEFQSTLRFTDRVADYVRYRPDYPKEIIRFLYEEAGVSQDALVADVGAGTGISSKLFLDAGHEVIAVEPNDAMRAAADAWLAGVSGYHSQSGTAEATGLPDSSVDLVAAAQAFHWFDSNSVRPEFQRILRTRGASVGRIALFWNSRRLSGSDFLVGYEDLLQRFGTDYSKVSESYASDEVMEEWFGSGLVAKASFDHVQLLDLESLQGRLLSSSYAPRSGHPDHESMLEALRELFAKTAVEGKVTFEYDTRIFAGVIT